MIYEPNPHFPLALSLEVKTPQSAAPPGDYVMYTNSHGTFRYFQKRYSNGWTKPKAVGRKVYSLAPRAPHHRLRLPRSNHQALVLLLFDTWILRLGQLGRSEGAKGPISPVSARKATPSSPATSCLSSGCAQLPCAFSLPPRQAHPAISHPAGDGS